MEPFRFHVYVCDQKKPEGAPSCPARGSGAVIAALRREIAVQGLSDAVQLTTCGSLGLCERGPNLVVYPEGSWYSGVRPEDVPEIVREHFGRGRPVARLASGEPSALAAEIAANRGKALAALAARDAAGVVPDEIALPLRAFMESRVLLTALELDVFTAVGGAATAAAVASARGAEAGATGRLLDALVALGFLDKRDEVFANTPLTARFLAEGSRDDARDALRHNLSLWRRWSTLTDAVRAGHAVGVTEMADRGDDWTVPFIAAMHRGAAQRAPLVVQAVGTEGVRRMLDVGGGSGAYSIAFARASATLRAEILDLPTVLPIAAGHVAEAGLADRVTTRRRRPAHRRPRLGLRPRPPLVDLPHARAGGEPRPPVPRRPRARRPAAASSCRTSSWTRTAPRPGRRCSSRSTCWWAPRPAAPTESRSTRRGWARPGSPASSASGCPVRRTSWSAGSRGERPLPPAAHP